MLHGRDDIYSHKSQPSAIFQGLLSLQEKRRHFLCSRVLWQGLALMVDLGIILSLALYQQGHSIFMPTSPFGSERLSHFPVQKAVGTFGHIVSQPTLSSARCSLLLEFDQFLCLLLQLPTGFGFWKRWTLVHSSCIPLFVFFFVWELPRALIKLWLQWVWTVFLKSNASGSLPYVTCSGA